MASLSVKKIGKIRGLIKMILKALFVENLRGSANKVKRVNHFRLPQPAQFQIYIAALLVKKVTKQSS